VAGAVTFGAATVQGILDVFLVLVFAIYFLIDGERTLQWLRAFVPQKHQGRISEALSETNDLIVAYTVGQFITSALAAIYVFLLLTILHVPLALLLGILAGIFDVLPVVGIIMAVVPAALMALTVSPTASLLVILFYSLYHMFENYFIVPKIYGQKLRLSTLTVLLSISIAGSLAGIIGAVVILPVVAAYPVIERLWFGRHLPPHTVPDHQEQAKS
jgi:predicted PurR-regulated permease PerM